MNRKSKLKISLSRPSRPSLLIVFCEPRAEDLSPPLQSRRKFRLVPQKAAAGERLKQQRLDLCADARVGVAGPRHVRLDREARAKRPAPNVRHDHPGLARDKLRAEVVRVTADAE